jgi:ParB-like chromosome segregation protein Spo0J
MKIEYVKISDLENHSRNPKQHPERQIRLIEKSIEKFGWTNPILLSKEGVILAGHARVKAAIEKGMEEVPCIRTKLTGDEADAYLLADNRLSDIAPYDRDILAELLADLPKDLAELTGFETVQIDSLLNGDEVKEAERFVSGQTEDPKEPPTDFPEFGEDIETDYRCPKCGYEWSGKTE